MMTAEHKPQYGGLLQQDSLKIVPGLCKISTHPYSNKKRALKVQLNKLLGYFSKSWVMSLFLGVIISLK